MKKDQMEEPKDQPLKIEPPSKVIHVIAGGGAEEDQQQEELSKQEGRDVHNL